MKKINAWKTKESLIGIGLFLFSVSLLLLFRSLQQIADSLVYAYDAKKGLELFNPHHLLYEFIIHYFYKYLSVISSSVTAVFAAQIHGAFWAGMAVLFLYHIGRKISGSILSGILISLSLLFANNFWLFSTQVEVYVPSVAPLIVITWLIIKDENVLNKKTFIWIFCLLALSIFYHQSSVLFVVPLFVYYWTTFKKAGLKLISITIGSCGFLVLGTYIFVYLADHSSTSVNGFVEYCFLYYHTLNNPDWGTIEHFQSTGEASKLFLNQLATFLNPSRLENIPSSIISFSFLILLGWNIWMVVKKKEGYHFRIFLLTFLVSFYLFLIWWTAGFEFFIHTSFGALLLLVFFIRDLNEWISNKIGLDKNKKYVITVVFGAFGLLILSLNINYFYHIHHEYDSGYYEAQNIAYNLDKCIPVTDFNIHCNLLYYHDVGNSIESNDLMQYYYYNDSSLTKSKFEPGNCYLATMWYLNPYATYLGNNGYSLPERWFRMFKDLFDMKQISDTSLILANTFEIIAVNKERWHLVKFYPVQDTFRNLPTFFQSIDNAFWKRKIDKEVTYADWYRGNKHLDLTGILEE